MMQNPFNGIERLASAQKLSYELATLEESIQWNWKARNTVYAYDGDEDERIHSMELKVCQGFLHNSYEVIEESIQWNWKIYSALILAISNILRWIHSMELKVYK